ncbi:MAG: chlorophyll synthesis pathway protein BchC [Pseudomonadales bacterium]
MTPASLTAAGLSRHQGLALSTPAVVLERPRELGVRTLNLVPPGPRDVVVEVQWSGISSGTERLLYRGTMPPFPGLAYPLVPGYESVGLVTWCGDEAAHEPGTTVFVPGARCFEGAEGLFGGAARRLVVDAGRVVPVPAELGANAVLLALAATAHHALQLAGGVAPLIIGHGVLGRLLARLAVIPGEAEATPPTVWELDPERRQPDGAYCVVEPDADPHRGYRSIIDVSGDSGVLNALVDRLAPGGSIVLAGFYDTPLSFDFAPAFLREATFKVAAQWQPADLDAVRRLAVSGALSLDGLITHREPASRAAHAYTQAFDDPSCLKMILDWSHP